MDTPDKTTALKLIRDQIVNLDQSPLYEFRVKNNYFPVIGEGNHDAQIMFIGEAPGENEAKTARPFVGAAGKFLDQLLQSINLERSNVYITNIVKDRPPENRDPTPQEIEIYSPFLIRQINIIQPKVIATLGRFSMAFILDKYNIYDPRQHTISKIHGHKIKAKAEFGEITIVPLYHPAVALYNGSNRSTLLEDFKIFKDLAKLTMQ